MFEESKLAVEPGIDTDQTCAFAALAPATSELEIAATISIFFKIPSVRLSHFEGPGGLLI